MTRETTMRRRLVLSLASLTAAICIVYSGLAFLFAYVVEDRFFASLLATEPRLPFVQRYASWSEVPEEVRAGARSPNAREVAGRDGRHYHLRRTENGWLVAEVSSLLAVRPMRLTLMTVLIPASAAVFLASIIVAVAIARRSVRQLTALSAAVETGETRELTAHTTDRELRVVAEALERAFARERAFTGDVSHELRTPLAVIRGAAELLPRNAQTARILEATDSTEDAIALMLALAREETAHEARAEIHVLPFVEKLVVRHRGLLGREDVEVTIDIPPQMRVVAPAGAAEVVLSNLITNALRHGGGTPIVIRGHGVAISVSNGRRADDGIDRRGIGLNLVRRLCDACGFTLSIETTERGTVAEIAFSSRRDS